MKPRITQHTQRLLDAIRAHDEATKALRAALDDEPEPDVVVDATFEGPSAEQRERFAVREGPGGRSYVDAPSKAEADAAIKQILEGPSAWEDPEERATSRFSEANHANLRREVLTGGTSLSKAIIYLADEVAALQIQRGKTIDLAKLPDHFAPPKDDEK